MAVEQVHILLFHRVLPERDPLWDPMDPALFKEVIQYVNKKFTVFSLEDYFFAERHKLSKPAAIITFDDGYHDFIDYSLPVLKKYNMPASMFVVTDCIDQNKPTWTYLFDELFYHTKKLKTDNPPALRGFNSSKWSNDKQRINYGASLKQQLKKQSKNKREEIIAFYETQFNDVKSVNKIMMSWEELQQIKGEGIEIGSHTVTHPPLATLTDDRILEDELYLSGMRIREKLGNFPAAISYPVGSYNSKVKNMAHKVGYRMALAVDQELYKEKKHGRFSIPRIELYNEAFFKTRLRINGTISLIKRLTGR
jgi:peptidoglycan/xylan/chitin deacetylase (PgdA/CDA1 family)